MEKGIDVVQSKSKKLIEKKMGENEYFATELQAVQGKERYDIKISQDTSNVSPNEGLKEKKH